MIVTASGGAVGALTGGEVGGAAGGTAGGPLGHMAGGAISGETLFVAGYVTALLLVVALLELYGRQSTSAWGSRVFAGYRRAVPDAPRPATREDWPHWEVNRFHHAVTMAVTGIALVLIAVELTRNHRPWDAAVLAGAAVPHTVLVAVHILRIRRPTAAAGVKRSATLPGGPGRQQPG